MAHLEKIDLTLNYDLDSFQTSCPNTQSCLVYGVHDEDLNNSQFFTVDADLKVNPLGKTHRGWDIEGLDIHPDTQVLFATSGQNPSEKFEAGALYIINKQNGKLTSVCHTDLVGMGQWARFIHH